jgi:hypothetical protein
LAGNFSILFCYFHGNLRSFYVMKTCQEMTEPFPFTQNSIH